MSKQPLILRVRVNMLGWFAKLGLRNNLVCPFCGNKADIKYSNKKTHKCIDCARRWPRGDE